MTHYKSVSFFCFIVEYSKKFKYLHNPYCHDKMCLSLHKTKTGLFIYKHNIENIKRQFCKEPKQQPVSRVIEKVD